MDVFVRDAWYVGAWASELDEGMVARTVLGDPIIFFRGHDGQAAALQDRCPHRLVPLSMGKLENGIVQCAYHGMQYDHSGKCVHIPSQEQIPRNARVGTYPLVERDKLIWIWMGRPEQYNPTLIPDMHWLDDPEWGAKGALFTVACNWRLILDNLMDLTHLTFVHGGTIGNADVTKKSTMRAERVDDSHVRVTRLQESVQPPPTYVRARGYKGLIDRWQIINYTFPSTIRLDLGAADEGTHARENGHPSRARFQNINLITPETEKSTHYFWAHAHDFTPSDAAVTEMIFQEVRRTFLEDVDIFEAQQKVREQFGAHQTVDLAADRGGVHVRKMIENAFKMSA